jgi:hypothetical protein
MSSDFDRAMMGPDHMGKEKKTMFAQSHSRPNLHTHLHPLAGSANLPMSAKARGCLTSLHSCKTAPRSESAPAQRLIFVIADRLVQIWIANESQLASLERLRRKQKRARAYAASPGSNAMLASVCLRRVEREIHRACAQLGANDREARSLVAELTRRRFSWTDPANSLVQPESRRRRSG